MNRMHTLPATILVAFGLLLAPAAQAQVYKYKDASGRTVFSDSPPPGVAAEKTAIKSRSVPNSAAAPAKSASEQEQEFNKRRQDAQAKDKEAQEKKAKEQELSKACSDARDSLSALESGQRVAKTAADGSRSLIDDETRAQEIGSIRKRIKENCK